MPVIPDNKDKLVNLEDMRALYEHELRDSTIKFIDGQPGFTPAGSMQLGTGCVGSLTPVERFGICKVTSGSMSDLTDFSSAFSMTNVGFSCSPADFNGSSTVSYDGSSTMKNSLAGFESNKNKSVLYADIDEMEVDGGSSSYTGNRARAALASSFLDGISSALILDVSDRHREFDLTLQVTSGEYSMSSDSPVFVKTDPNLSPIGKLAPVSPSPSVPMILPEIDDLPTPRRTDADLPGLVVPDDDTIVCENNGIISIKHRGVSESLLSHDVMSQLTGLQEIGPTGIANIENALPAPLVTTKLIGQSNQVTTTGKNLLDISKIEHGTSIVTPIKNGIRLNTKTTSERMVFFSVNLEAGKSYVLSYNAKIISGNVKDVRCYLPKIIQYIGNGQAFTPNESTDAVGVYIDMENVPTIAEITNIQLEEGAIATAYEPYTGGKPSPSPEYPQEITNLTKAEIVTAGKNLLEIYSLPNQPDSGISASMENDKSVIVNGMTTKDNADLVLIDGRNKLVLPAGVYTLSVNSIGFPDDCNVFIRDKSGIWIMNSTVSHKKQTFSFDEPVEINECSVRIPTAGTKFSNARIAVQLEVGGKATGYTAPATKVLTPIDLKGNELCSLPNGVKDEVVIDAEGNVSLIKRVTKIQSDKLAELVYDVHPADENGNLPYVICNFNDDNDFRTNKVRCNVRLTGNLKMDKSVYATWNALVVVDTRFTDVETAKQILKSENGIYYYEATPQTIPLGKVELPALPETTSNIWNDGNIPADVSIIFYNENGRLLSKAIPEVDVATVDEVKKFLGIK